MHQLAAPYPDCIEGSTLSGGAVDLTPPHFSRPAKPRNDYLFRINAAMIPKSVVK
jgi:hypothetical protein